MSRSSDRPELQRDRGAQDRLADAAPIVVAVLRDTVGIIELAGPDELVLLALNPAMAESFGRSVDELEGAPVRELHPPEQYADVLDRVRRTLAERSQVAYEVVRELPTGRRIIAGTMQALDGRRVLVIGHDVSHEREVTRQLHELEALADIGTWHWNLDADEVTWSPQLRRILGIGPDEPASFDRSLERVHPDDRPRVLEHGGSQRTRPDSTPITYRVVHPDGRVHHVESRAQGAYDDGRPIRVFGTLQDVTERVLAEQRHLALQQAQARARDAIRLNDSIVQGLSAAWLALHLGLLDDATEAVHRATDNAQQLVSELLGSTRVAGRIEPGELARGLGPVREHDTGESPARESGADRPSGEHREAP